MRRVRWGIAGAGKIAETFAADVRFAPSAKLCAVAAREKRRAEAFAFRHGLSHACGSYRELFGDEEIDAVYIATPHSQHFGNARDALRSGKAVLCEKPLTASPAECRRLLQIAADSDKFLMEAMWTWFLPAVRQARHWLQDGRIGRLVRISADFGFRATYDPRSRLYDPALAGGCLLDIGIYPLALAHFLIGTRPDSVDANALFAPTGVEDEVAIRQRYGDVEGVFLVSFRRELSNRAIIHGEDGHIELPLFWAARECRLICGGQPVERYVDPREGTGFEYEIEAASRDILAGRKQSAVMTHAATRALHEAMAKVASCYRG